MELIPSTITDVIVLQPSVHGDERGYFMETFRQSWLKELDIQAEFVQDNQSKSIQGTLRGLHYQLRHPQGKLVRVVAGEIFDVAVDIRASSPSFGHWVGDTLSAENKKQLWIPPGFAHGFYVTSDSAEIVYKCTDYYYPDDDHSLLWNDPALGIQWPLLDENPLLSGKDRAGKPLAETALFP